MMHKNQVFPLLFFVVVLFSLMKAEADTPEIDTRKIITAIISNQSNADWKIRITLATGDIPEVSDCHNNEMCLIPKYRSKVIFYKLTPSEELQGGIEIIDSQSDPRSHSYTIEYKKPTFAADKLYINHPEGNTGNVLLNNPDDGNITIKGDTW